VQALEAEVAVLREQLNRNSGNSSQPPSSDGPKKRVQPSRQPKSERQRGGQPGHAGRSRKLVPLEQVKTSYDLKPPLCHQCRHPLEGEDAEPYRHQVTDIPPVVAEVTEYRVHTLGSVDISAEPDQRTREMQKA
jgi:transposase